MKRIAAITLTAIALSLSSSSFAIFGWSQWDSCKESAMNGQDYCSECQCTDPNHLANSCISTSRYCEAFGNAGEIRDY